MGKSTKEDVCPVMERRARESADPFSSLTKLEGWYFLEQMRNSDPGIGLRPERLGRIMAAASKEFSDTDSNLVFYCIDAFGLSSEGSQR